MLSIVVVLTTHFRILSDAPLPGLATDQGATHSTGQHATCHEDDGGGKDDPPTPSQMRYEQQDVNQERQ